MDKETELFLRDNFRTTKNSELSERTGIKNMYRALAKLGLKRTPEEARAIIATASKDGQRLVFTKDHEKFLRDNMHSMSNREIGEALGFKKTYICDKLAELGLRRTDAQRRAISKRVLSNVDYKEVAVSRAKIEGGSRNNSKSRWHLVKWQTLNGPLKKRQVLVYRTGDFDSFEDLMVISRSKFANFVRIREKKKEQARRKEEKEKQKQLKKPKRVKSAPSLESIERRKAASAANEKFEEFKRNYKPKTIAQAQEELVNEGKVPVKIDHKTTVWVRRDKCVRLENGSWVKKSSLTNENNYEHKNERADTGTTKGTKSRGYEASEPENEIHCREGQEGEEVGGTAEIGELSHF